ncbi:hypothetical protein D3C83_259000 [compost metagenome]
MVALGAGVVGTVGFGLSANAIHDDFEAMPSEALRDDGIFARDLANVSLAVAVVGAVAILVDLLLVED